MQQGLGSFSFSSLQVAQELVSDCNTERSRAGCLLRLTDPVS